MSESDYPTRAPSVAEQEAEALLEYQRRVKDAGYDTGTYAGYVMKIRNVGKARMIIRNQRGDLVEVEYQKLTYSPYMSAAGRMKEMWAEHRGGKQKLTVTTEVLPVWLPPTYPELEQLCRQAARCLDEATDDEGVARAAMVLLTGLRRSSQGYVDVIATLASELFGKVTGRVRAAVEMKDRGSAEQTRPIETAETSAVGRAAAMAGYGLFPGAGLANGEDMKEVAEREQPGGGNDATSEQRLDEAGNLVDANGEVVPESRLLPIRVGDASDIEKRWLMQYFDRELHLNVQTVMSLVPIGEHADKSFGQVIQMVERASAEAEAARSQEVETPGPRESAAGSSRAANAAVTSDHDAEPGGEPASGPGVAEPAAGSHGSGEDGPTVGRNAKRQAKGANAGGGGGAAEFFATVARSGARVEQALGRLGVSRVNDFPGGAEGALQAFKIDLAARAGGWESGQEYAVQVYQRKLAELTAEELLELSGRLDAASTSAA